MFKCPFCNQPMQNIASEDYNGYTDAYYCPNCDLEQAIHLNTGERIIMHRIPPTSSAGS